MSFVSLQPTSPFEEILFVPPYAEAVTGAVSDYFLKLHDRYKNAENPLPNLQDLKNFEAALSGLVQILETIKSWELELVANLRASNKTEAEEQQDFSHLESIEGLYKNWLTNDRLAQLLFAHFAKVGQQIKVLQDYKLARDYVQRRLDQFENDRLLYEDLTPAAAADARKILGL